MRQTSKLLSTVAVAAFFAVAGSGTQAATLADACSQYATLAVEQNSLNQSGHCRLAGARWSNDANGHRAWCMAAGPSAAISETKARETALNACLQGGAELNMIQLQSLMSERQTAVQLTTNLLKALNQSQKSIINNMR